MTTVTKQDIVKALAELGVKPGDLLEVLQQFEAQIREK